MIFVGDIALPYKNAIVVKNIPSNFKEKNWFGNLEGALIEKGNSNLRAVYNDIVAIKKVVEKFNFKGFALANNHILDTGNFKETIKSLSNLNISFCGVGENILEAAKELVIDDNDTKIVILNFGWEVIQCKIAKERVGGVNPIDKKHIFNSIHNVIEKYPKAKVIPFMHWSYELESEPQPFERRLAKEMIDIGASGVIGCHPHRIGGFELYKGKPIVYSLGNWLFKQDYFCKGKIKFPDFCDIQLAFEWDFLSNDIKFHFFKYKKASSEVVYLRSEGIDSKTMLDFTPFNGLNDNDYKKWYKKNHYHKKKGLPIYYWKDPKWVIQIKNKFNHFRILVINKIKRM